MSTVIEKTKQAASPNGATATAEPRTVPLRPIVAAPLAAAAATVLATRLVRRRRPAQPSVYWSLTVFSGNHIALRPTLAPRFGSLFLRTGRPRGRRLFRRRR